MGDRKARRWLAAALFVSLAALHPGTGTADTTWRGSFYLGYVSLHEDATVSPKGSIGGRANAFTTVQRSLEVGIEAGYASLGTAKATLITRDASGAEVRRDDVERKLRVWHLTPFLRVARPSGRLRPYALGGAGLYGIDDSQHVVSQDKGGPPIEFDTSDDETAFGFHLGAGTELWRGRHAGGVEVRWHSILGRDVSTSLLAFLAGISFR